MPNDVLEERFAGAELDRDVWLPHYLPAWSSRAETVASWQIDGGHDVVMRIREVLREVADVHRGETALVVSRGGVLRLAVPALARMDAAEPVGLDNCATIEVEIDADDWVCRSWGNS